MADVVIRPSNTTVTISPSVSTAIIDPSVTDAVIDPSVSTAVIYPMRGLQGPAGPAGPAGADGALGYYGAFSDYTDQTIAANTAQAMTFNTTDEANGVSIVSGSQITFAHAGTYNVQWSGQFENTSNQEQDVSIWLRKNGADVTGSTGFVAVVASHGGIAGHVLPSWNFVFTVAAGDYYEFYWSSTSALVSLQTYPVSAGPTRPSTASLVLTVTQVMNNQQGPAGDPGVHVGPTPPADTSLLWVDTS